MEKLTITKIVFKDKNKDGKEYTWPSGDKYTMIFCQTLEYGETWFSCAKQKWNEGWKENKVIEAEVEHSADGKWHNLKRPDPIANIIRTLNDFAERITRLEKLMTKGSVPVVEKEIDEDSLPF